MRRFKTAIVRTLRFETDRPSSPREILVGRVLACCAHPHAAWRLLSPSGRLVIFGSYAVAAYVTILTLLLLTAPASRSF